MFFSRHHSNSHERRRRAIHWNWSRREKAKWSRNASRSARQPVRRVPVNRSVRAWRPSSMRELKLKIHAIEVGDEPEIDNTS